MFDVAKNGLDSVKTALSSVQRSASTFATEAKSEFAPQTTALQQSLTGVDTAVKAAQGQPLTAASTQAIVSSLTQVKTAATDLQNAISGNANDPGSAVNPKCHRHGGPPYHPWPLATGRRPVPTHALRRGCLDVNLAKYHLWRS
jgi:hypothetical protein